MSLRGKPATPASRTWNNVVWALLVLAVVAPIAFLANQSIGAANDRRSATIRERHAVAYLTALAPLTGEVFLAQAFALRGGSISFDDLSAAVARVAEADRQWGDELRTRERWSALEQAIGVIYGGMAGDSEQVAATYQEIVSQLLALHGRVRDQGGLLVDPDLDAHYLAETVATELPATLAAVEDYANGLLLVADAEPDDQIEPVTEVMTAAEAVAEGSEEISEFLELAVSQTDSPTLGQDLINELDTFRRSVDQLGIAGSVLEANAAVVDGRRVAVRNAGTILQTKILSTLDRLLAARANRLAGAQRVVLMWVAPAALLTVVVLVMMLGRRRDVRVIEGPPEPPDTETGWGPPPAPASRDGAGPLLVGALTRRRDLAPNPERTNQHAAR
jgi:hypothetical protein